MVIWYATVPICMTALLSGYVFYINDYEKPAFWIAIYSSFLKNMWGFFLSVLVTGIAMGTGCKYYARR